MLETLLAELLVLERAINTNHQLIQCNAVYHRGLFQWSRSNVASWCGHNCQTRAETVTGRRL